MRGYIRPTQQVRIVYFNNAATGDIPDIMLWKIGLQSWGLPPLTDAASVKLTGKGEEIDQSYCPNRCLLGPNIEGKRLPFGSSGMLVGLCTYETIVVTTRAATLLRTRCPHVSPSTTPSNRHGYRMK